MREDPVESLDPPALSPLVDTHAHLADSQLSNLDDIVRRAQAAGLRHILAIGTTAADSQAVSEIARDFPGVHPVVGIHPNHCHEALDGDWDRVVALAQGAVALGETGLDRYWDFAPFALQQEFFDRHLDLAEALDLPVVIHCRDCEEDVIARLARRGRPVRGVLHSFAGGRKHADALLDLGLHLSFSGMLTFSSKKLDPLREVAGSVPDGRILVETDSPYLAPHPFRGKRNEPARVVFTARRLAELRRVSPEAIAKTTTENATRLFHLESRPPLAEP